VVFNVGAVDMFKAGWAPCAGARTTVERVDELAVERMLRVSTTEAPSTGVSSQQFAGRGQHGLGVDRLQTGGIVADANLARG
jgi:hypothetical protein